MSEQSLREALVAELRRHGVDEFFEVRGIADAMARVSAAHPAEPDPVVTDEAVEAACERMHGPDVWQQMHASEQETKRAWMRFALEAAAPLLAPRPQVGVVHVQHADSEEYARIFNLGFAEAVEQHADESRPLLDRDALGQVLISFGADVRLDPTRPAEMFGMAVDAVMELARPMPTEVEIAERVRRIFMDGGAARTHAQEAASEIADAVLALLNGAES